ncbi:hypothetical protein SY88_14895 [Clostridiales bacterium PH28_bin88]|nr:hypothetical protein SY88_14895 [Clostridiales bacterium PH28_bin88]
MYGLRILLADPDPHSRKNLKGILGRAGHQVFAEAGDGRIAAQLAFNRQPDMVILDVNLPVRDGLEVARVLEEHRVAPVLLLIGGDYWEVLERAKEAGVYGCLVKPVSEATIIPEVEIAWTNFQRIRRLEEENRELRETLETRKLVEKAKGILMEKRGITEGEAYQFMRKLSMDRCTSLGRIAKAVLRGEVM